MPCLTGCAIQTFQIFCSFWAFGLWSDGNICYLMFYRFLENLGPCLSQCDACLLFLLTNILQALPWSSCLFGLDHSFWRIGAVHGPKLCDDFFPKLWPPERAWPRAQRHQLRGSWESEQCGPCSPCVYLTIVINTCRNIFNICAAQWGRERERDRARGGEGKRERARVNRSNPYPVNWCIRPQWYIIDAIEHNLIRNENSLVKQRSNQKGFYQYESKTLVTFCKGKKQRQKMVLRL